MSRSSLRAHVCASATEKGAREDCLPQLGATNRTPNSIGVKPRAGGWCPVTRNAQPTKRVSLESAAEWVHVDELRPWERNPRKNDPAVPKVAESIRRFGFVSPIVVWQGGKSS